MDDLTDQIKAWTDATAAHNDCEPVRGDEIMEGRLPGDRRQGRRHRASVVAAAAVVLVAVIAATIGLSTHRNRRVVTTGSGPSTRGPGAPIFAGLSVQPGSTLMGTTFPSAGLQGTIVTTAFLTVEGDPNQVFNAYVAALTRIGFAFTAPTCGALSDLAGGLFGDPGTAGKLTGPFDGSHPPPTVGDTVPAAGTKAVECGTSGTWSGGPSHLRNVSLDFVTPANGRSDFSTTLMVNLAQGGPPLTITDPRGTEPTGSATNPPSTVLSEPYLRATTDSHVASVGEVVAPAWMDPGSRIRVADGSTLLAPAVPLNGGTLGWITVVRIDGDPSAVLRSYLSTSNGLPIHTSHSTVAGRQVLEGDWDSPGGAKVYLTATRDGDGTWFMIVNVQND